MKFRIEQKDLDALQRLSNQTKKPMADIARYGVKRMLDGDVPLPVGRTGVMTAMSFDLPREQEEALKTLAKNSGVSLEDVFRTTLRDLLFNAQTLIDRINAIAETQEGIQRRQNRILDRDEALIKRREMLMEQDAAEERAALLAKQAQAQEQEQGQDQDEDDPPLRAYTRGVKIRSKSKH